MIDCELGITKQQVWDLASYCSVLTQTQAEKVFGQYFDNSVKDKFEDVLTCSSGLSNTPLENLENQAIEYETNSVFGDNSIEIIINAREHIITCTNCLKAYKSAIGKSVYFTADNIVDEDLRKDNRRVLDVFKHLRKENDVLGIIV